MQVTEWGWSEPYRFSNPLKSANRLHQQMSKCAIFLNKECLVVPQSPGAGATHILFGRFGGLASKLHGGQLRPTAP